jgi:Glycosyltransferase WbsX
MNKRRDDRCGWRATRGLARVGALAVILALAGCGPSSRSSTPARHAAPGPTHSPLAAAYPRYEVGAYYFSGWSHGQNNNISRLLTGRMHASEPLIGWYDDSQAQVDKAIDQAADSGIDFFAFDWYDIARSPYATDKTLNEGLDFYRTSRERHRLKYCLVFVDFPPFMPRAGAWPHLVDTWITGYFRQPDYVRVDGKPLFIVFSPEHMRTIFGGSAGVRKALDVLRARARARGLPGVTIAVAATVAPQANPIRVQELIAEHYDAATGYNYHAMGGERYRVPVPYARLVAENVAMWNRVAARLRIPYIPVITSGWDQRFSAREQDTAIIYDGRTPRALACYAVLARHWIDTHLAHTTRERLVLLYAWNEIGEGGAIIPDHRDGYAYADVVRMVFGGAGRAPTTPSSCHSAGA